MPIAGDQSEAFLAHIMDAQRAMYTYVLTLVGDLVAADDVLQETNLVLWRKREEFTPGTDFLSWALSVAHFQVLAYRKRRTRDRLAFNDELIDRLAAEAPQHAAELSPRRVALVRCMAKLSPEDRLLIEQRYATSQAVGQIAEQVGRTVNAVYTALNRIRTNLMRCIEQTLAEEVE
ncbi:sigma-70 family RNA polymerase sigma factor [Planctomycetales bacterium ZRK34]|nr:sigma-70 family RNA polymerase sigma factor [Planctomycetales bacterium ZRK34]